MQLRSTYQSEILLFGVLASVHLPLLTDCTGGVFAGMLEGAEHLAVDDRHFVNLVI